MTIVHKLGPYTLCFLMYLLAFGHQMPQTCTIIAKRPTPLREIIQAVADCISA
jgi:hypothetical protein